MLKTESLRNIIIITLISFYVLIVIISAWLSDDAYITFRTVDNFINGFGLTWNIGERVQTYTHPLWMFLLSVLYFITREIYFTSIIISILISAGTILLLFYKLSRSITNTVFISLILILSKAFVDYSTSGLENPLTHLLIVVFFILYLDDKGKKTKLFNLTLIASLAILNRMDTILIFLPPLLFTYYKNKNLKTSLIALAGFSPFILWELFSLFYYGFLFPNTAFAKLNTGISQIELIQQGLYYLLYAFFLDPLTPSVILVGLLIPLVSKNKVLLPITIGIALYIIYIINIGGDFMGGRFLSAPFLCSVIIISKMDLESFTSRRKQMAAVLTVILLGFLSPKPTIFSTANYGEGPKIFRGFRFGPYIVNMYHGITDQRMWYYHFTGLLNNIFNNNLYEYPLIKYAHQLKEENKKVVIKDIIGMLGFYCGRDIYILDTRALSDPLLSKIPSTEHWKGSNPRPGEKKWIIGHFNRKLPEGYLRTVTNGKNEIDNVYLRKYYDKISLITRGNLFDFKRLIEIWNLNTGKYDYFVEEYNKTLSQQSD